MTTKILRIPVALGLSLLLWSGAGLAETRCHNESFSVITDFDGANIHSCHFATTDLVEVEIRPEDEPINKSPWYGFRVSSTEGGTLRVVLNYDGYKHRYKPNISLDRQRWQALPDDAVELDEAEERATFLLKLPESRSVYVTAQPLLTSSDYEAWFEGLASSGAIEVSTVGRSIDDRPLWRGTTTPKPHTLLLLGRQHPPEVTGAVAMMSFVERLMEADELASQFREQVAIVMYPLVNPDGVDKGYWRHNFQGKDLNREWGPFSQPENRIIDADVRQWLESEDSQLIKAIDFHSTYYDVFYTQADRSARIYPDLLGDWLVMFQEGMLEDRPDFEIRRQISKNPQQTAAKHYFFTEYDVSSTTLEIGDRSTIPQIKAYGRVAAEAFMAAWLKQ